jgi:ribose transport system permease protein
MTTSTTRPPDPRTPTTAGEPDRSASPAPRRPSAPLELLERYGLLLFLAGVAVLFSVLPATTELFPTGRNIDALLGNQTVVTIAALAAIVPLIPNHFDVSVGSVLGLSAIGTAAAMSRFHASLPVAILVGVGIGALIGVINGALIAYGGLNAVIVTLAATIIISGVVELYTSGVTINTGISGTLTDFGSLKWLGIPRPAWLLLAVCLVVWYVLEQTPLGRRLYMIGENPQAAHLIGVRVKRLTFLSFVIAGALAGVAGVVLCARTGGANPNDGPGYLFPALVAAFLGTTAIRPGRFNVWGTLAAVFFVAVTVNGLSLSGAEPWVQPVFNGVALLVAVALAALLAARRRQGRL